MFKKLFSKKAPIVETSPPPATPNPLQRFSPEELKARHKERKKLVIHEFGQSVINFLLSKDIWTPVHIVDILEVDCTTNDDLKTTVQTGINQSLDIHKTNLREVLYKKSLNFQPGNLLLVVKERNGDALVSFRTRGRDVDELVTMFSPDRHRLILVRYFIPPVPDDLYKYDDVDLPLVFQDAVRDIVNYCDLNYSLDNVNHDKWQLLINGLSDFGISLNLPNHQEDVSLNTLITDDYSDIGYYKITAKLILKDTVEKRTIVIPLFILFLAFFCSDLSEKSVFPYHYLFAATGSSKEISTTRGLFSFPKLFNQLLDESLLPQQFSKCLSIIYNEAFRLNQSEIDDLLVEFRDR